MIVIKDEKEERRSGGDEEKWFLLLGDAGSKNLGRGPGFQIVEWSNRNLH